MALCTLLDEQLALLDVKEYFQLCQHEELQKLQTCLAFEAISLLIPQPLAIVSTKLVPTTSSIEPIEALDSTNLTTQSLNKENNFMENNSSKNTKEFYSCMVVAFDCSQVFNEVILQLIMQFAIFYVFGVLPEINKAQTMSSMNVFMRLMVLVLLNSHPPKFAITTFAIKMSKIISQSNC